MDNLNDSVLETNNPTPDTRQGSLKNISSQRSREPTAHSPRGSTYQLELSDRTIPVAELHPFSITVHSSDPIEANTWALSGALLLGDTPLKELELRCDSQEPIDDEWLAVLSVVGKPLDTRYIDAMAMADRSLSRVSEALWTEQAVPERLRTRVHELVHLLRTLEKELSGLEAEQEFLSVHDREAVNETVARSVAAYLNDELPHYWSEFHDLLENLQDTQRAEAVTYCRERLLPYFLQSPFVNRSNQKPRGYAGDYEMMNLIYRNETLGASLYAKSIHRYYISHPNAEAVRNRAEYLFDLISGLIHGRPGEPLRILSVASGPAREISMLLESGVDCSNVEVELLDQDPQALTDAYNQINDTVRRTGRDVSIKLTEQRIKQFIKDDKQARYDLVYSAGLFDYLPDSAAIAAAKRMRGLLQPEGRLIIGNFRGVPRHRAIMELAMDWQLIYRTPDQLRTLFGNLGPIEIDSEPKGINLFVRTSAERINSASDRSETTDSSLTDITETE